MVPGWKNSSKSQLIRFHMDKFTEHNCVNLLKCTIEPTTPCWILAALIPRLANFLQGSISSSGGSVSETLIVSPNPSCTFNRVPDFYSDHTTHNAFLVIWYLTIRKSILMKCKHIHNINFHLKITYKLMHFKQNANECLKAEKFIRKTYH